MANKNSLPISLKSQDYYMSDAHFEIGPNIHADSYYNAKKYFQDTDNSENIAGALKSRLTLLSISNLEDFTIVGFGSYSGLFLNKTIKLLKPNYDTINYALVERDDDGFLFSFDPELNENIIIVLPITSTFEPFFQIKNYIEENFPGKKVQSIFLTVFLILHETLCNLIDQECNGLSKSYIVRLIDTQVRDLYLAYNWEIIDQEKVIIQRKSLQRYGNDNQQFTGYFIEHYSSKLYPAEKCPLCFYKNPFPIQPFEDNDEYPLIQKTADDDVLNTIFGFSSEYKEEYPLFQTASDYDALNIIFGFPSFGEKVRPILNFNDVFEPENNEPIHLYGYLRLHNNKFLNFIRPDIFYKKNKDKILNFFFEKLSDVRIDSEGKHIVILTPGRFRNSNFLEDLIDSGAFEKSRVSIIPYQPFTEFLESFINYYSNVVNDASTLIYYDDVIGPGLNFKLISDYLKNTRAKFHPLADEIDKGFDYVVTLVDRTTEYSKKEIKRKFATNVHPQPDEFFIAFFKLNVPQIDVIHIGEPIKDRSETLEQIYKVSHLDALKIYAGGEILKMTPKHLQDIKKEYQEKELKYFPFVKDIQTFQFYESKYTFQQRNLVKLRLLHEISTWFIGRESFELSAMDELLEELTCQEKLNAYFKMTPQDGGLSNRDMDAEKAIINDSVLKILSRPPFRHYKEIYGTVFKYNNTELAEITNQIIHLNSPGRFIEDSRKMKITFNHFRKLKMHIRRSIELNSNFIISFTFLQNLKEVVVAESGLLQVIEKKIGQLDLHYGYNRRIKKNLDYQKAQIITFKYFLLHCYKELIFSNPSRSIVLEQLLNHPHLLPVGVGPAEYYEKHSPESILPLEEIITNSYYQLGRILKSENIYLLNELKELYIKNNAFVKNLLSSPFNLNRSNKDSLTFIKEFITLSKKELIVLTAKEEADNFLEYITTNKVVLKNIENILGNRKDSENNNFHEIRKLLIKQFYFYNFFDKRPPGNDIIRQAYLFLFQSKHTKDGKIDSQIKDAVLSMLYTVALLQNTGHSENQNQTTRENSFNVEINRILSAVCSIIGLNLNYSFFIEYRERGDARETNTDNIFSIVSTKEKENKTINLHKDGLIYSMLNGLTDYPKGNIQTFTAIAKTNDGIVCLKDEYFRLNKNDIENPGRVVVKDALELDYLSETTETGSKMIRDAKMILLFRLANTAEIQDPRDGAKRYEAKGRAVLAICGENNIEVTTQSFVEFANVEKMRLLLLIKEQILEYLQKQFYSEAFIEVLEDRKILDDRTKLNHGITNYMLALDVHQNKLVKRLPADESIIVSNVIINAIVGQIHAGAQTDTAIINVTPNEFRNRVIAILEDKDLGEKSIDREKAKLQFSYSGKLYRSIYNIVIPELIINMKRHSPFQDPEISVQFDDNSFVFRNRSKDDNNSHQKNNGGQDMCRKIVENLKLKPLEIRRSESGKYYEVTLSLDEEKEPFP